MEKLWITCGKAVDNLWKSCGFLQNECKMRAK